MKIPHISLGIVIVFALGYVAARYFPAIGRKVGLP